jgi:hypothetical protein
MLGFFYIPVVRWPGTTIPPDTDFTNILKFAIDSYNPDKNQISVPFYNYTSLAVFLDYSENIALRNLQILY